MKFKIILILILIPQICLSDLFYVDPDGDNDDPGTIEEPWQTLEHAFSEIDAGDTLYLREGIYNEGGLQLSSSGNTIDGYIIISSYPEEDAIIDGTDSDGSNGFAISGRSYFKLENLEIRDFEGGNGLWITDCHHFQINDCEIHHCFYGIGVAYGSHDFILNRVHLHHFMLYGFDATPLDPTDPCYNGILNDCRAHTGLDDQQNVDGFALGHGSQYNFEFNRCITYDVYDGFDISSRDVTLNECSAYDCANGGFKLWQDNISLINCTSFDHGITCVELDWNGNPKSVLLQNCTFFNAGTWNIWVENTSDTLEMYNCIIAGGDNIGLGFGQDDLSNYFGDNNIFHCDNAPRTINSGYVVEFSIDEISNGDWADYSGQDENSMVSEEPNNELFVNSGEGDLSLLENSIAIDQGRSENAPPIDQLSLPRPQGSGYDIGAFEWWPLTCNVADTYTFCSGENISISYTVHAQLNTDNIFSAELSNDEGNFSSPFVIGSFTSTSSGSFLGQIPDDIDAGTHYRIRVNSSDPLYYGAPNLKNISISSCEQDYSINTSVSISEICAGDDLSVYFSVNTLFDNDDIFSTELSDENGGFDDPVTIGTISSISSATIESSIPENTSPGGNYRIRVVSSSPVSYGSDNGDDIEINQCVILISPENNAEGVGLTPVLDWQDVYGALSYSIQVATNNAFDETLIDESTEMSEYEIPLSYLVNQNTYYWRVRADLGSSNTEWSRIYIFETFTVDYSKIISFQGILSDENGDPIEDGEYSIIFRLYRSDDSENILWKEQQEERIVNSYIMAYIGLTNPLNIDFSDQYCLEIVIEGQTLERIPLTASPYSIGNVRSVNNMNGMISITGGEGITITNDDGRISIDLDNGSSGGESIMTDPKTDLRIEIERLKKIINKIIKENTMLKNEIKSLKYDMDKMNLK